MTDLINPKAVADELRACVERGTYSGGGYEYVEVGPEDAIIAADTIEALVEERDELAAVIERAREAGRNGQPAIYRVIRILSAAPADVLREHDAALIEALADHLNRNFQDIPAWTEAYRKGVRTNEWMGAATRMTMSAIGVIRERARQVREGEA